jgi:hypothetical protein
MNIFFRVWPITAPLTALVLHAWLHNHGFL